MELLIAIGIMIVILFVFSYVSLLKQLKQYKNQPTLDDILKQFDTKAFESGRFNVNEYRQRMETVKKELDEGEKYEMYDGVPLYNVPVFTSNDEEIIGVEVITNEIEESLEKRALQRYR